jgi:hypothetical protein
MGVALLKKNTGGARADLRQKIAAAAVAEAKAECHRQAIERARTLVRSGEAKLEEATAAVASARDHDAKELAQAITAGGSSPARATRQARAKVDEAPDDLETSQSALASLREGLGELADEAERSQKVVVAAIVELLVPVARALLAEARDHKVQFQRRLYALDVLSSLLPLPTDIKGEKERLPILVTPEAMELSRTVQRDWKAALETLKTNADAPLPDTLG